MKPQRSKKSTAPADARSSARSEAPARQAPDRLAAARPPPGARSTGGLSGGPSGSQSRSTGGARDGPSGGQSRSIGGARDGPSGSQSQSTGGPSQNQANVRSMIARLNRDGSPSKRQRAASPSLQSSESEDDPSAGDEQLTSMQLFLQRELRKQTALLTERFDRATDILKEELRGMHQRVDELEQHVNEQGNVIQQLRQAVDVRDDRVYMLEDQVEEIRRVGNLPFVVFDGPGIPKAPSVNPWSEDVGATTKAMLTRYMPAIDVQMSDIKQCFRVDRGKRIVCEFSRHGPGSDVHDGRIHDGRMSLLKDEHGQTRDANDQIYANDKLTPGAAEAFRKLRGEKKSGRLHSVHTKHGFIFVRRIPYGAKIRVSNQAECEQVLRGER